jgi:protein involved in polysaccharide export with SLBB domain
MQLLILTAAKNSKVKNLIRLNIGFFTLLLVCLGQLSFANSLPERQQKQAAINAASTGQDLPLQDVPLGVVKQMIIEELEEPSEIEKKISETLKPIDLTEKSRDQKTQLSLEQFGYDIFNTLTTTFAPVAGIPVPEDYTIGPGDTFILKIFSVTDLEYRLVVNREGQLLVPEIGAIQVAGLSFSEVKELIKESIDRVRVGVKTIVTLAELHSIQILMVGEVKQPGTYTVSGLSSLLNTLIQTGGIKRTGSLRSIVVKREGREVANFDLYELLLRGNDTGNIHLRQGDIVFVKPIGKTVSIAGEVHRPAIYETDNEQNVDQLIDLAGGLLPTAAKSTVMIERVSDKESYQLISADLTQRGGDIDVKNGDLIKVLPVLDRVENVVLLGGHVLKPGAFQWSEGLTVTDVVGDISSLKLGADLSVAMIERENLSNKRTEVFYFNLERALGIPSSPENIVLKPRDRVVIFNTHNPRTDQLRSLVQRLERETFASSIPPLVQVKGFVRHGGTYPLAKKMTLLDLVEYSGGFQVGTDQSYVVLVRTDPKTMLVDVTALDLNKHSYNPVLASGDELYLFGRDSDRSTILSPVIEKLRSQSSKDKPTQLVNISGSVRSSGTYPLNAGMRVEDLLIAAGGLKEQAFNSEATLARRSIIENEFSRVDQYDVALTERDNLSENLTTILLPNDHLVIRQKPEWISNHKQVTIEGEVLYPGTYTVDKRETMCGLVQRAGGFTEDAYLFGTVFTRESVRRKEQEALDRMMGELDDLLADVHLSPGYQKQDKQPENNGAEETFKIIKQLAPKKAVGRLVVDMENAVRNCTESSDVVLEAGDRIFVPKYQDEVSVVGQVYFPTSHKFRDDRATLDYINLSGGMKELAQHEHAFVVQANGEVMSVRSKASSWGWLGSAANVKVTPGSTIYVPLSVDRINGREFTQSWVDLFYKLTLSASSVSYLFKGN